MFFPLHLSPPQYREILIQQILNWCDKPEKKLIYSSILDPTKPLVTAPPDKATGLIERNLSKTELVTLETYLHEIVQVTTETAKFGGFVIGQQLSDINSLAIFNLSQTHQEAYLTLFIANTAILQLEASPIQSPLLLLAIAALLREKKTIEKLYLPFYDIQQEQEDFLSLAPYELAPDHEHGLGWWQQANTQRILAQLLLYPPAQMLNAKWLEIYIEVKPALVDYVSRLISRYSCQQRILIEQQDDDETPAVLRAYLPIGLEAEYRIRELNQKLVRLSHLCPISPLQLIERDLAYWQSLWITPNLFRINANLLLTPNRKDYIPVGDEILVEIPASSEVFASNEDGPHATTALCLQLMAKYINPKLHINLLDLGTGGGTLAIIASFLGVGKILALDAFPPAVEVARTNVQHNGVTNQVTVEVGSLAVLVKKDSLIYSFPNLAQQVPASLSERLPFDVIVSNTFYHVLIGHAKNFYTALRPGGLLISGGIFKQKANEVATALQAVGFELTDQLEDESWVSFVHARPF